MKLGMVGLPNVGKSTLFNVLSSSKAQSANYPFCTIEPNTGVVSVPDHRLDKLSSIYSPDKITRAILEIVDIAGLVEGASKGEGLGNKFLSNIREVDAIIHVVRCFEDGDIIHVSGNIDPKRDIETINLELIFSDIDIISRRIDKSKKLIKSDKKYQIELDLLEDVKLFLEEGNSARSYAFKDEEEIELIQSVNLLSFKPVIYAANLCESDFVNGIENNENYSIVCDIAKNENSRVLPVCAKIEEEIAEMDDDDKELFLCELNLKDSGLDRIVKEGYKILGLISYLTAGKQEVRAWTIKEGTKAPAAAGKIHTDFERGFIRAEIISYTDLIECGNMVAAKEKGLVRLEGKDYTVNDGDVILFRFNV